MAAWPWLVSVTTRVYFVKQVARVVFCKWCVCNAASSLCSTGVTVVVRCNGFVVPSADRCLNSVVSCCERSFIPLL